MVGSYWAQCTAICKNMVPNKQQKWDTCRSLYLVPYWSHQMPWPTTTYENPTMSTWPSLIRCYESVGPIGGEPVCWHIRNGEAAFLLDKRAQVKWVSANHWWTRFPRSTASVSPFTRCVSSGPPIFAYPIHYSHWKKVFQQHNFVFVYLFFNSKKSMWP